MKACGAGQGGRELLYLHALRSVTKSATVTFVYCCTALSSRGVRSGVTPKYRNEPRPADYGGLRASNCGITVHFWHATNDPYDNWSRREYFH